MLVTTLERFQKLIMNQAILSNDAIWFDFFVKEGHPNARTVEGSPDFEKKFYLAKDTPNGGKKFLPLTEKPVKLFRQIRREFPNPEDWVFYEYVVGPQKMHLDLDFDAREFPNHDPRQFECAANTVFHSALKALVALEPSLQQFGYNIPIRFEDLCVTESHRVQDSGLVTKYSWHILINGFYLRCNEEARFLFDNFVFPHIRGSRGVKELFDNGLINEDQLKKCVDGHVFLSKQQWRLLHCRKRGVSNVKKMVDSFLVEDLSDSLGVRFVETNWTDWDTVMGLYPRHSTDVLIINLTETIEPDFPTRAPLSQLRRTKHNTPPEYFEGLLDLIRPSDWADYDKWVKLLSAMWHFYGMGPESCNPESEDFQRCARYSQKTNRNNYDENALMAKLHSYVYNPTQHGWTTVRELAMQADPAGVARLDDKFATEPLTDAEIRAIFLSNNGPFWGDLVIKNGKGRKVKDSPAFLRECQKVIATLQDDGDLYWLVKGGKKIKRQKEVKAAMRITIPKKENTGPGRPTTKTEIELTLNQYLNMHITEFISFSTMDFIPFKDQSTIDSRVFNLFSGFEALLTPSPGNYDSIQMLLNHIKTIWCCGDENHYQYLLKWFAWIFQRPNQKTGVMVVLHSVREGAGKSMIMKFLRDRVIGRNYFYEAKRWEELLDKFNSSLMNKILTVGDELNAGDMKSTREKFDQLKNMITSDYFTLNAKCEKQIEGIQDHNNYFITTNSRFSTVVSPFDRRTFCLSASNERVGDKDYFDALGRELNRPEAGRAFFDYLVKEVRLEQRGLLDHPPSTLYREQQILQAGGSVVLFIRVAYEDPKILFSKLRMRFPRMGEIDMDNDAPCSGWIRTSEFRRIYRDFCTERGYNPIGEEPLLIDAQSLFGIRRQLRAPRDVDEKRPDCVFVDLEKLRSALFDMFPSLREAEAEAEPHD